MKSQNKTENWENIKKDIRFILTPPPPREVRQQGVESWNYEYSDKAMEYMLEKIMEKVANLLQSAKKETIENIENWLPAEFNLGEAIEKVSQFHEPYKTQELLNLHTVFIISQIIQTAREKWGIKIN